MGISKTFVGVAVLLVLCISSCAPTKVVKPLDKGEKRVTGSLGGPLIQFAGAPIPIPFTSIAYQVGIDTGLTLSTGAYATDLLFGVIHTEVNLAASVYQNETKDLGVTLSPGVHLMYDLWEGNFRAYPQLDATCWWQYSEKPHLLYGGLGSLFELSGAGAHDEPQPNDLMPFVTVGHEWVGKKWSFQSELKYNGFWLDNSFGTVTYISPSRFGALGLYLGVRKTFGK